MNGITRYIFRQLVVGLAFVVTVLCGVVWLSQSLRFVDMIVNRGLSVFDFIHMTVLLLPNFIPFILPLALFIIVLFVYNKLINDREIMVMRAAGVSPLGLAIPALILTGIAVIVCYIFTLYLLPTSYRMFRDLQWDLRYNYSNLILREGAFNSIGNDITIYVRERSRDGQLLGLLYQDDRDKDRPVTIMAARGALLQSSHGPQVVVFDGNRQEIDRQTHKVTMLKFDRYTLDLAQTQKGGAIRYREARERMLGDLLNARHDPTVPPQDYGKFIVEGHQRLLTPWTIMGAALIALVSLISGGINRSGQFGRVLLATGVFAFFQLANMGLQNMAARNLNLIPVLYAVTLLPVFAGAYLLIKPPRHRRPAMPADSTAG